MRRFAIFRPFHPRAFVVFRMRPRRIDHVWQSSPVRQLEATLVADQSPKLTHGAKPALRLTEPRPQGAVLC